MRPALLYGSEIVIYSKTWIKALEVAQNQVARWVTGTGPRATRIGLRGELGWRKMECEIWERKLGYFGVIKNMGDQRWPKKILIAEEKDPLGSSWLREVRRIMREVGLTYNGQGQKEWKRITKRAVKEWELQNWEGERETHVKLGEYPKEKWGGREEYLNFSLGSKMLCKFRINDVDSGEGDQMCGPCGAVTGDMRRHILTECRPIQGDGETTVWEGKTKQPGEIGWLKEVLHDQRNWGRIKRLGIKWRGEGGGEGIYK